jgi:predicted ATP-dependent endonuclease of OLD family
MDWPGNRSLKSLSSFLPNFVSKDFLQKIEQNPIDVAIGDFMLIIDEPELSLSIEWQEMILPDILKSGKCKSLIAATHSPFIFDNELDDCAHSLDEFRIPQT